MNYETQIKDLRAYQKTYSKIIQKIDKHLSEIKNLKEQAEELENLILQYELELGA